MSATGPGGGCDRLRRKEREGVLKLGVVVKTRINRHDFGMEYNKTLVDGGGLVIGNDVDVLIDVELEEATE